MIVTFSIVILTVGLDSEVPFLCLQLSLSYTLDLLDVPQKE